MMPTPTMTIAAERQAALRRFSGGAAASRCGASTAAARPTAAVSRAARSDVRAIADAHHQHHHTTTTTSTSTTGMRRRDALAIAVASLLAIAPTRPPSARADDAKLPRGYTRLARKLTKTIRETVELEAAGASEGEIRKSGDPVKGLYRDLLTQYDRNPRVSEDASYASITGARVCAFAAPVRPRLPPRSTASHRIPSIPSIAHAHAPSTNTRSLTSIPRAQMRSGSCRASTARTGRAPASPRRFRRACSRSFGRQSRRSRRRETHARAFGRNRMGMDRAVRV